MKYINRDFAKKEWIHHEPGLIRGALRVTIAAIAVLAVLAMGIN
jgi:hypothetical protein